MKKSILLLVTFLTLLSCTPNEVIRPESNIQLSEYISLNKITEYDESLFYNAEINSNTFSFTDKAYEYNTKNKFNIVVYLYNVINANDAEFILNIYENGEIIYTQYKYKLNGPNTLIMIYEIPQSEIEKTHNLKFQIKSNNNIKYSSSLVVFSNNINGNRVIIE